jgi:ABC-2 type transport system permease protein
MNASALLLLHKPFAFLRRDFISEFSYRLSFLSQIAGILFSVIMFYFIAYLFGESANTHLSAYGGEYFPFVLIGIAFYRYMNVALITFSQTIREGQMTGTLEAMLVTPTKPDRILIYSSLWKYLKATFEVLVYLFFGAVFFGFQLGQANLVSTLLILVLTISAFSVFGILSAAFVLVFKRGDPVFFVFGTVSALLGGVYYPVTVLPKFLQAGSALIPLTYSLRAMRHAILQGASIGALAPELLTLTLFSAVGLPLSLILFQRALCRAREEGTLSQY